MSCVQSAEKRFHVVTTFLPAYCFAASVAGNLAEVENLLPSNVSLHDYQLTPGDIRKLAGADLIVVNGLGMETFLDKAIANAGPGTSAKMVRLSDGLKNELINNSSAVSQNVLARSQTYNPHIWLNPNLAMHSVTNIVVAFSKFDPPNANIYAANAATYITRLRELDSRIAELLRPIQNVPFITYHHAFPYLAQRYGLKLAGVVERVPEVDPSPRELSELHKSIHEHHVKALFTEPAGRTRLARQIAADAQIKIAELDPIETGRFEPRRYEEVMLRNAETLLNTLK